MASAECTIRAKQEGNILPFLGVCAYCDYRNVRAFRLQLHNPHSESRIQTVHGAVQQCVCFASSCLLPLSGPVDVVVSAAAL